MTKAPRDVQDVSASAQPKASVGIITKTAAVVLVLIVLVAILAPWIAPYPQDGRGATHPLQTLLPPSSAHWFGTDELGRDVLSRVIFGARTSLVIVVSVLAIAGFVGVCAGVVAGYVGGATKTVVMRITDIFLAFPSLLLALALAAFLQPDLKTAVFAIAIAWWPWYARLTAATSEAIKNRGYVVVARCLGMSPVRIMGRHVLPNSTTPILVQLSLDAGGILLTAAGLSYLGLGVQEPIAEWGRMVQQGQALATTSWWVVTFPGLAILLTAFTFNVLGEGLREHLDPRRDLR